MNITYEQAYAEQKNPRVQQAVFEALDAIGETLNDTLTFKDWGGQGMIFTLMTEKYPFTLAIKVPFYGNHRDPQNAEHSILKEARISEAVEELGGNFMPRLICFSLEGHYIIREFVEGNTLEEILLKLSFEKRRQFIPLEWKLASDAFGIFHKNERYTYVIRDFKPRNIIVSLDCKKLSMIDCGSCRREDKMLSLQKERIHRNFGSGKFLHCPLEQLVEIPDLCSHKVDYFSFGVMLYYTLFLKYPYSNSRNTVEEARKQYALEYEQACMQLEISTARKDISELLKELIASCLNPDPKKRVFKEYRDA